MVHTKANDTWSAPTPVDFPLGFGEGDVERSGIFDYDFDVVEYTDGRGNQDAYVLLVSGERPAGDNTHFDTASTSGMLSVVRLRISNDGVRVVSHTSWRSTRAAAFRRMATIVCSAHASRWARRWSTDVCRALTSTAAGPPQKRRSAARLRLRWSALPCGRTFLAIA